MTANPKNNGFNFLKEYPLNSNTDVEFGHREIIGTLKKIVCSANYNLTIGLFGGWGTGKSTIVEVLREELKEKKIPLILFDVWKHEGDALRRTFLKELDDQLSADNYGKDYIRELNTLNERVYASSGTTIDSFRFSRAKFLRHLFLIASLSGFLALTVFMLYLCFKYIFAIDILNHLVLPSVGSLFASVLTGGLLFKYIDSFIKTEKKDIKFDRFQDPHEFEMEFDRLVDNLKEDREKIVIAFDNLDRVNGDSALKVIATIKTFLNYRKNGNKKIYFLIPCDVAAIKGHIAASLRANEQSDEEMYLEEFLRKFFNTSIWIPDFYTAELENFATKKLVETNVPAFHDDYLSWLITTVYYQNPRQIIQFINSLLSNYLLMEEFCESGGLAERGFYKKNVPQLAKFLLIKQKFPDQLDTYRKTSTYNLYDRGLLDRIKNESFQALLTQTEDIVIISLAPFFKYRITRDEQEFPGVEKLLQLMITEDPDMTKYASEIRVQDHPGQLNNVLKTYLLPLTNPILKMKFINQVLKLADALNIKYTQGFNRDIINFLCSANGKRNIHLIDSELVSGQIINKATNLTKNDRVNLIEGYLVVLTNAERLLETAPPDYRSAAFERSLYKFVIRNRKLMNDEHHFLFKSHLIKNYGNELVKEILISEPELQEFFITNEFKDRVLGYFDPENSAFPQMVNDLRLMNLFEPKGDYTNKILHVFLQYWDHLFSIANFQTYPDLTIQLFDILMQNLAIKLKDSGGMEGRVHEAADLVGKSMAFLDTLGAGPMGSFISLIWRAYLQQGDLAAINGLLNNYLHQAPLETIRLFIDSPVGINGILKNSAAITRTFEELYIKNSEIEELTKELIDLRFIPTVIIRYAEFNRISSADLYIREYKDLLGAEEKKMIEDSLMIIFGKNAAGLKLRRAQEIIQLVMLLCDRDAERVAKTSFWNSVAAMIVSENVELQEIGYKLFEADASLLLPSGAEWLHQYLLHEMIEKKLINHYFVHEALISLAHVFTASTSEQYISFVFDVVLTNATDGNVFLICPAIINGKFDYDVMKYEKRIMEMVYVAGNLRSAKNEKFQNYQTVLIGISKRLERNDKQEKAVQLRNTIKPLIV